MSALTNYEREESMLTPRKKNPLPPKRLIPRTMNAASQRRPLQKALVRPGEAGVKSAAGSRKKHGINRR